MDKTHRVTKQAVSNRWANRISITVVMCTIITAVVLFASSCERPVLPHAQFIHLADSGWTRQSPLTFHPVYDDSTRTYDISIAVRHKSSYGYGSLPMSVDVVGADSAVHRHSYDMCLADEYGNWLGGGFGTLYQQQLSVARGIKPSEVSSVIVWQTLDSCERLMGIADVGIICEPSDK